MSYDPALGRFLERDPIGYDDGANAYQSFGGNPIGAVDPFGLKGEPGVGKVSGPNKTYTGKLVQWTLDIPKGVAHYQFKYQVYGANNEEVTQLVHGRPHGANPSEPPAIQAAPGEHRNRSEYYFHIGNDQPFELANILIGSTGERNLYVDPMELNKKNIGIAEQLREEYWRAWGMRNTGVNTSGRAIATIEVRDCPETKATESLWDRGYHGPSVTDANRAFLSFLHVPLAGAGVTEPDDWKKKDPKFKASIEVTWGDGRYKVVWNTNNGVSHSTDGTIR